MIEERGMVSRYGEDPVPLLRRTYRSLTEYWEDAGNGKLIFNPNWTDVQGWDELGRLCRDGWAEKLPEALEVTDEAVRMVEREIDQFEPVHASSGGMVDVAAAVAGLPEDMVAFPLTRVSGVGTVVRICCDVQCNRQVSNESVIKRGMVVVALALALDHAGHGTELWVSDEYDNSDCHVVLRTLVKGPNDFIDPARIMFAYAHPAVQRGLGSCAVVSLPAPWGDIVQYEKDRKLLTFGYVTPMTKDMPEGTLYVDPVFRDRDNPNAGADLRMYLAMLGVLPGDEDEW